MKINKKTTIVIVAEYGSEFQMQVAEEALSGMLQALKMHVDSAHKQNKMEIMFVKETNES